MSVVKQFGGDETEPDKCAQNLWCLKDELEKENSNLHWKTSLFQKQTQELREDAKRKDGIIQEHYKTMESLINLVQKLQEEKAELHEIISAKANKCSELRNKVKNSRRKLRRKKCDQRKLLQSNLTASCDITKEEEEEEEEEGTSQELADEDWISGESETTEEGMSTGSDEKDTE